MPNINFGFNSNKKNFLGLFAVLSNLLLVFAFFYANNEVLQNTILFILAYFFLLIILYVITKFYSHTKGLIVQLSEVQSDLARNVLKAEAFESYCRMLEVKLNMLEMKLNVLEGKNRELVDVLVKKIEHHKEKISELYKDSSKAILVQAGKNNTEILKAYKVGEKNLVEILSKASTTTEKNSFAIGKSQAAINNVHKEIGLVYDRIDALMSIHGIIKIERPLPIMHGWRISSDYAVALLDTFLQKKGGAIDIGSGVSTLLLGYAAKSKGLKMAVKSIEHEEEYYLATKALIKEHKLEEYCSVSFCPLTEVQLEGKKWEWYDISGLQIDFPVDLVSVDGPPGKLQPMSRYPAIPILASYLSPNVTIYLDDGNREEEKMIAEEWSRIYGYRSMKIESHKGYFKLERA